jgi:hypothetical protein
MKKLVSALVFAIFTAVSTSAIAQIPGGTPDKSSNADAPKIAKKSKKPAKTTKKTASKKTKKAAAPKN